MSTGFYKNAKTIQRTGADLLLGRLVEGDVLVISLYYRRTDQRTCIVPCPFGTVVHEAELDSPVLPSLTPIRNPATPKHCSESP